ncbi:SurA N-terminal domain-containing protein [Candidatus Liberibacter asiaticus]|uniref:SurA N-terminal domain-containing protein n=1 Tax=Liberibacter asiaticus TaxID=34021 RepID=UPI0004E0870E|nr:SurA N-terminal domain-containing protein [Candidatus Liberibacter asiaticus]BAP26926.1 peptidyl prolyl cis-trans isomerase D signal peptide protein [Candidatus Liberibacter asiaticus str. Ishi-1]
MLEIIRKASRTWVAKIFLVVLFVPFLIWGLSDALFSVSGSSTVVSVGRQKVPFSSFINSWKQELGMISQKIGFVVNSERARSVGLDKKILDNLVSGATLDQFIEDIGLEADHGRVWGEIARSPLFHGKDNKFSHDVFVSRLAREGINEKEYIDHYTKMLSRTDVVGMFVGGMRPSNLLLDQAKRFYFENRSVDYIVLNNRHVPAIADPSNAVLTQWFEKYKDNYRAPEYKRISYILFDVHEKEKKIEISNDELQAEYEKNKEKYFSPEIRTVEQLVFPNQKEADEAFQSLKKGKKFIQLAEEQGKSLSDISLGSFSKEYIPDVSLADSIFSLAKKGDFTPVIHGSFGYVIAHVSNIKPSFTVSFQEVKKDIANQMRITKASEKVKEDYKRLEEFLALGTSMDEISRREKIVSIDLPLVDFAGKDVKGKEVAAIPYKEQLLFRVFGKDDPLSKDHTVALPDGSYMWVQIKESIPARDRKLEEVLTDVKKDWKTVKTAEEVSSKANQLVLEYRKEGKNFRDIGKNLGASLLTTNQINRMDNENKFFGYDGISQVFSGPVEMVKCFPIENGLSYVVFKVTNSKVGPVQEKDKFISYLTQMMNKDLLDSVIAYLKSQYSVTVHDNLIQRYLDGEK